MKFLIALSMLLSLSLAHAQSVESFFNEAQTLDTERPVPGPGPMPGGRIRLFMRNDCYTDVLAAIRVQNIRGQAESRGIYRLFPGQVVYMADMISPDYLLSAATSDNRYQWTGPYALPLNGVHYSAMMIRLPGTNGDWTTVLYCR